MWSIFYKSLQQKLHSWPIRTTYGKYFASSQSDVLPYFALFLMAYIEPFHSRSWSYCQFYFYPMGIAHHNNTILLFLVASLMSLMAALVTTSGMQQWFNVLIDICNEFLLFFYCCVPLEIKLTTTTSKTFFIMIRLSHHAMVLSIEWIYLYLGRWFLYWNRAQKVGIPLATLFQCRDLTYHTYLC